MVISFLKEGGGENNNEKCEKRWVVVTFDLYCRTRCCDYSRGHELFLWRCRGMNAMFFFFGASSQADCGGGRRLRVN